MVAAFKDALAQMTDPRLRRVLWLSLGGGVVVTVLLALSAGGLLAVTQFVAVGWLETLLDVAGVLTVVVLVIALYPATVSIISGLLLEDVARAVEARHYPKLPPARKQPVGETILTVLAFAAVMVAVNLLVLPLYLLPMLNIIVFLTMNGYLLGREYFELVACRRLEPAAARKLRKEHRVHVLTAGLIIALFASVPFLNLMLPLFGAAFMVHVFERLRQESNVV